MCLLKEAASAWLDLVTTEYEIIAGRKGKQYKINLIFECTDFPHLAGMHYASDVAFNLNANEYHGEKLVYALVSDRLDGKAIEKSRNWTKIQGRLKAIINLKQTLDTKFQLALFNQKNVPTGSKIDADYLIKNLDTGETYFIFIDEDQNHRQYCKSAFAQNKTDYMKNQALLTLLKITKFEQDTESVLFIHPNFTTKE